MASLTFDGFQEDVIFGCFWHLDHCSNCRLQTASRTCLQFGRSPYLWRLQYEAACGLRNILEDSHFGARDWLGEFKRLNPLWEDSVIGSKARVQVLVDEADAPPDCGGQDPRVFSLGSGKVLLVPGGTYGERRGGHNLQVNESVYLMDISTMSWQRVDVTGEPHPSLHGSYCGSYGDGVVADKIVCFGGGSMASFTSRTSLLELGGLVSDGNSTSQPCVRWSRLITHGEQQPSARFAGLGHVWDASLLVFAGRTRMNFFDELWLLDLKTLDWSKATCSGEAPSARVWCRGARCGDSLLVYGGAEWRFDHLCWGNDSPGKIWTLQVAELSWSCVETISGPQPPLRVCPTVAMCGRDLLVFGGNNLPTQEYLDDMWLFDTVKREWTEVEVEYGRHEDPDGWCRSHVAAIFCRERRSCLLFGGGRYFEGIYFHEISEISSPHDLVSSGVEALPLGDM
eukprot:TRINITY_DN28576_c0_g1_i1.p1 TRINITY_DN28576_c0_g1~~TRINITY_DN28576_c0_g1_i1.p1  ORF type:complete len:461 (+),score=37.93 TRINITY_DN28576_c0_g1_i1:22-1383(+)